MKFIAQECPCCDDVTLGLECSMEDLQRDEEGNIFLAMTRDEMSKVFTQMDNYIGGRPIEN